MILLFEILFVLKMLFRMDISIEMLVFRKILHTYLMDDPLAHKLDLQDYFHLICFSRWVFPMQ